ncbi:hypothetical protein HHI36_017287 [Cryptolaemus montrouzieri]|uniref:HAT C-terminal dimerisation domain-containing protein n=1 Tax=Cryptolaemus montrouzieri TaxID=559131 RepID=A0ABD2NMI6_9CUCU
MSWCRLYQRYISKLQHLIQVSGVLYLKKNIRQIALQLPAMFGSTYLCESAFSEMKIIQSKYRNKVTDDHMSSCLRLALSGFVPSYEKYAEDVQCYASTSKVAP